jgi:cold shock CspA family protein
MPYHSGKLASFKMEKEYGFLLRTSGTDAFHHDKAVEKKPLKTGVGGVL